MQIEVGKFYKTRDGRKVFVAAELPDNPFSGEGAKQSFRGYIEGSYGVFGFTTNGRFYHENTESSYDLIAEWVEPPTALELAKAIREYWPACHYPASTSPAGYSTILKLADAAIAAAK